jgi:mono/diheme cytochrome c family protein
MRNNTYFHSALFTVLAGLVACSEPSMPDRSDGHAFFSKNCTSCHGQGGAGDGPLSKGLSVAPTDLTTLSRSNGGKFPATRALAYIWGDPEQSHLARVMPQFGGAMAEDLVPVELDGVFTPTPRALAGLLAYLESIQK